MRYRIALCGFSEFEFRAMLFSFQHPSGTLGSEYEVVADLAQADFLVVDADAPSAVKGVIGAGQLDQAIFIGTGAPSGASWRLPRPIDTLRILRMLDDIIDGQTVPVPFHDVPSERVFPTLDDAVDDTVDLPATAPPCLVVDIPASGPVTAPALGGPSDVAPDDPSSGVNARRALQSLAKAAARAAARRARLASAPAAIGAPEPLRDVLVLDADRSANQRLCELLERFGFLPHPVHHIAQADGELARRPYAAVFLDIALDDRGGDLLQRIRALPRADPHASPAVLMVTATMDPTERVRAALAGVAAPLVKPLTRGDVARALESVGVVLPSDARRG